MALKHLKEAVRALEITLEQLSEDMVFLGQTVSEEDLVTIRNNITEATNAVEIANSTAKTYTESTTSSR